MSRLTNMQLNTKLCEVLGTLRKYAAVDPKSAANIMPIIETISSAQQRLLEFADNGPERLNARDEVALRMLQLLPPNMDDTARMMRAYKLADVFFDIRHDSLAGEF